MTRKSDLGEGKMGLGLFRRVILCLCVLVVMGTMPTATFGDGVPIGELAFDVFIPAASTLPGENTFDIANETGGLLAPGLGVASTELFTGTLTVTLADGSKQSFAVTNLGPGFLITGLSSFATFSSDTRFLSAVLTGTLDVTSVQLNDGSAAKLMQSFSATLNPLPGDTFLTPCGLNSRSCDEASIFATTASVTTPEPGTALLVLSGLGICWARRRRLLKGNSRLHGGR